MDLFDREFEEHLAVAAASKAKLGPAFRRMLDTLISRLVYQFGHLLPGFRLILMPGLRADKVGHLYAFAE